MINLDFKLFLEQLDRPLPTEELGLPSVKKTSTISFLERNKNPIFILLSDGTKIYLSWDEFKRIEGTEPVVGKKMTVVFQRNPADRSESTSQIERLICH
jgi:hypothetical protein